MTRNEALAPVELGLAFDFAQKKIPHNDVLSGKGIVWDGAWRAWHGQHNQLHDGSRRDVALN